MKSKPSNSRQNILFLKEIEAKLKEARIPSAMAESELLLRHVAKMDRLEFFTGQSVLSRPAQNRIRKLAAERRKRKPLSYLLNKSEFYGLGFYVNADTLIPRPETELLVEEALRLLDESGVERPQVLDIGTGSGCLAVSLTSERPHCRMTALDLSPRALKVARKNRQKHNLQQKIKLVKSDLWAAFGSRYRAYWDLIVSNPPYIPAREMSALPAEVRREPAMALNGGKQGLEIIYKILDRAPFFMKPKAYLLMEIGKGQSDILKREFARWPEFTNGRFIRDFAGIERVLVLQKI